MRRLALLLSLLACTACTACTSTSANVTKLRVLSYNIKHGHGNDGKVDIRRAAGLIRRTKADLVVLQEIDNVCRRSGGQDQMSPRLHPGDHRRELLRRLPTDRPRLPRRDGA